MDFADPLPIASLRDIEVIERTPLAARGLPASTYDLLRDAATQYGESPALTFLVQGETADSPVRLSFRALFARITQAANLFHRLGVRVDAPVAYLLPNLPQTHEVIWGGEAAGAVCAVNPLLEAGHIIEILKAVRAKALVTLGPFPGTDHWAKALQITGQVPSLGAVLQIELAQYMEPGWQPGPPKPDWIGAIPVMSYDAERMREPADHLISGRKIASTDIASYFHTGGTTGAPKIAPHTHANEVFMAWELPTVLGTRPNDVFLCGLPLFHVNGVMVTGLGIWVAGAHVLLAGVHGYRSPKFLPGFWRLVERYRINYFSAVPTIYSSLLDVPVAGADVSSLRYGFCGAAPMPPEVFRRFEALTGLKILEGYGLTEGTAGSVLNPAAGERRIGAIGLRMPYQQVKVAVLDADGNIARDAAPGEIGVVVMRGPQVFPGYLSERDNKGAWTADAEGNRWLNTGDLARSDGEGYFWLAGRAKDLIIRGGHNIEPQLIEEALCRHPAVAIAAAVGQPDAHAGEVPMCYVVLREGATASESELLDFAKRAVPERAAVPVRIVPVPQMPVTAVGKIFKPALRYRAIEQIYGAALAAKGVAASVTAGHDAKHGTIVRIALQHTAQKAVAEEALARYTVPYTFA
jgi:fatty-acyl-CoA synthase